MDHIIHLSAPGMLRNTISEFENMGFEVLLGGKHADGLTENALIVLDDGVYIELIQFIKEVEEYPEGSPERQARTSHWWASMKENGWIDYSLGDLTSASDVSVAAAINHKAEKDKVQLRYDDGVEGGRVKPNGDILRWLVTFPAKQHKRGGVPFFCKDLTPRERRVPWSPGSAGSGSEARRRIAAVTLMTRRESLSKHIEEIRTALGISPMPVQDRAPGAVWILDSPGARQSVRLELISAQSAEEVAWTETVDDIGVWEVTVHGRRPDETQVESRKTVGRLGWI